MGLLKRKAPPRPPRRGLPGAGPTARCADGGQPPPGDRQPVQRLTALPMLLPPPTMSCFSSPRKYLSLWKRLLFLSSLKRQAEGFTRLAPSRDTS